MAPYSSFVPPESTWEPEQYQRLSAVNFFSRLPRYGFARVTYPMLSDGAENDYVMGIVISSCCLLLIPLVWLLLLIFFKFHSNSWLSGSIKHSPEDFVNYSSGEDEQYDDSSSASSHNSYQSDEASCLSIDSSVFWTSLPLHGKEVTMAAIAREQEHYEQLHRSMKRDPQNYSETTNGRLTLITMLDTVCQEHRVYIPPSLRLPLLRTYHDSLVHPDNESNAQTLLYDFFTWKTMRQDASKYVERYERHCRERKVNESALVRYDRKSSLSDTSPITLDVIAKEQREDDDLLTMVERSPSIFSTATNGTIQLITARGKDKKYRIVIPRSFQAKVLMTYHDCLVNPTAGNNFRKGLYVHFTWNGIHKDVKQYVLNNGLTEEMRARAGHREKKLLCNESWDDRNSTSHQETKVKEPQFNMRPIGLDEIAREQKRDPELRRLRKEEPFVFSTVRYGNTLLNTAQNFRDNRYRIVIPKKLQWQMLNTYRECLLNPNPNQNFDTLLYNHFTWNGIHDDVDYFVKHGGSTSEAEFNGRRNKESSPSTTMYNSEEVDRNIPQNAALQRKVTMIRVAFLVCGLSIIIFNILLLEKGLNTVSSSLDDAQRGIQHITELANSAVSISGQYLSAQPDIHGMAKNIATHSLLLCCPTHYHSNVKDPVLQLSNSTHEVGEQLGRSAVRVELEMKSIKHDLGLLVNVLEKADATVGDFKMQAVVVKTLVIIIAIIVLLLITACLLSWMRKTKYIRRKVIMALLLSLSILVWLLSVAVLSVAMTTSDVCSVPDESAMSLLMGYQDELSPFVSMSMMHYVSGCSPERRPTTLDSLTSSMSSIGTFLHSQLNAVVKATDNPNLKDFCGDDAVFDNLIASLAVAGTTVHGIHDVLIGMREILECHNVNPIYSTLLYKATCGSGVTGLSWLFFTSLCVAILSMIMVTLRVSMYEYPADN